MITWFAALRQKRGNYYYVVVTTSAAIITGTINYLYHPMMIRYLSSADFAIFQSLMSMFNIFSVISAGFGMYLTQQFSRFAHDHHRLSALKLYWKGLAKRWGGGLFLFLVSLSPVLQQYLHLPSAWLVVVVAFSYLFTGYVIVFGGLLQGAHKFEAISCILIAGAVSRVTFGALAMGMDLGVAGAIAAVSCASIIAVSLQRYASRRIGALPTGEMLSHASIDDFRTHLHPILFFALVALVSMILSQIDIFVVQHRFFGSDAGIYVAVSVLAKFIFFLAGSVETVYYPQLSKTVVQQASRKQIRNYLTLLAIVICGGYVGSWLFGSFVLYLFKPTLVGYQIWLLWLLLASGGIFVFTTILKLLVAWKQHLAAKGLVCLGAVVMLGLHRWGDTLSEFVHIYTRAMSGLAICALCVFRYTLRMHHELSVTELGSSEI